MNDQIAAILRAFIWLLIIATLVRAVLSWFPVSPSNPFRRIVHQITDPLVEPVRRRLPGMGGFDFSPLIVILVLYAMLWVVGQLP